MLKYKYKDIEVTLDYTVYNKIDCRINMGKLIDEEKSKLLLNYVLENYLSGILATRAVSWLLSFVVKRRVKKAAKFVWEEVGSGRYDKEVPADGNGEV